MKLENGYEKRRLFLVAVDVGKVWLLKPESKDFCFWEDGVEVVLFSLFLLLSTTKNLGHYI